MQIVLGINVTFTPSGGSLTQVTNMIKYLQNEANFKLIIFSKIKNRTIFQDIETKNITIIESRFCNISALTRVIWEQLVLPLLLIKYKIDVLFCPGDISPIFSSVKKVQWIGTIGPFWDKIYSYDIGIVKRIKYPINKLLMYKSAESADHVIFESDYTKKIFLERYKISEEKTSVINIGKDEFLIEVNDNTKFVKLAYEPFVLCVSHLYPYKNLPNMIESFYIANEITGHTNKLIIAGSFVLEKYTRHICSIIDRLDYKDNVILLGLVTKNKLRYLYENCEFLIFPSPCENFAYTLVEAMSLGAPIVCSNTTAMPDTCLNAALYFDPYNKENMTEIISQMLGNTKLQNEYKIKSIKRALDLPSYEEVTNETIDCFYKVMKD
jgi:glycosyltransferase involved in cell wall biosynthesis